MSDATVGNALSNREWAVVVWLTVFVLGAMLMKDVRSVFWGILKMLVHPKIAIPIVLFGVYIAGVVLIAWRFGLWDSDLIKDTIIWTLGPAFVLFFNLTRVGEQDFLRRTVRHTLTMVVVLEFIVNLYSFSLPVEIVIVPATTVMALTAIVAGTKSEYAPVGRFLNWVLAIIGFGLVGHALDLVVRGWATLDKAGAVRELVLPIWLTLAIVPIIYVFGLLSVYETIFVRLRFVIHEPRERRHAKWALVSTLHFRAGSLAQFGGEWQHRLTQTHSFKDARATLKAYRRSLRHSGTPPHDEADA